MIADRAAHHTDGVLRLQLATGATYGAVWQQLLWVVPPSGYRIASGSVAERVTSEAVVFPHQLLLGTEQDLDDIVEAVRKVCAHTGELAEASPTVASRTRPEVLTVVP